MDNQFLEKDIDLPFPHFAILKASAGSGKTYTLSLRFVQFLLSRHVVQNRLRNILAMTFSNNAAKEMRNRILNWLKRIALGETEALDVFSRLLDLPPDEIQSRASAVVEEILEHYGEFQVKTIDSFATSLFQAAAAEFGFAPGFEIMLDSSELAEYSFQKYLRKVSRGTYEDLLIDKTVKAIVEQRRGESAYVWDPAGKLLEEMRKLYDLCSSRGKTVAVGRQSVALEKSMNEFRVAIDAIQSAIELSGLQVSRASSYFRSNMPEIARRGRIVDLIGKQLKNPPVNKPGKAKFDILASYEEVLKLWEHVREIISILTLQFAYVYYEPYASVFLNFRDLLDETKRRQGRVFIGDINSMLATQLERMSVPDIYFRIGESIHHFFIDEFQDTAPVQWKALLPLLENTVAERGSVFLVGDTKQAIYGFRDADYRIMAEACRSNPFPSAKCLIRDLTINYRSAPVIIGFNEMIFKQIVAQDERYYEAAAASGLSDYEQRPASDGSRTGYVNVSIVKETEDGHEERIRMIETIEDLRKRNFRYGDMAILTQRNEEAIRITEWLNESGIEFLSFSSLDIRRRGITREILALLSFLDSPIDSLSFASFLLGEIFSRSIVHAELSISKEELHNFLVTVHSDGVMYLAFADRWPTAWEKFFSGLIKSVGYLPLYDLISKVYYVFNLFGIYGEEEATLMRLLETVKDFEGTGYNSLAAFLKFAGTEEGVAAEWQMTVPAGQNAVRVMTVHKSKGLDFPATIVVLYENRQYGLETIVDEDQADMQLMRITKEMAECNGYLSKKYAEAQLKEKVSSLNALYVGLTRARDELHVIGISKDVESPRYPINIFPGVDFEMGSKTASIILPEAKIEAVALEHKCGCALELESSRSALRLLDRRRGEILHLILAEITILDGGAKQIDEIIYQLRKSGRLSMSEKIDAGALNAFFGINQVMSLFSYRPGRKVFNEYEITDKNGRLYRIDRLIIDEEIITVVDFKTGVDLDESNQHVKQVGIYKRLIEECFHGSRVEAMLAYVDERVLRKVV